MSNSCDLNSTAAQRIQYKKYVLARRAAKFLADLITNEPMRGNLIVLMTLKIMSMLPLKRTVTRTEYNLVITDSKW
jgi:hypothetical protein